jgi:beta-phosphoglucomutase
MIKAVIFDLDGVIVTTDNYHYEAWKKLADDEGIYFDRTINERLRGVSRMESLEILLEKAEREYSIEEKKEMAERKNNIYEELIKELTPKDILPGALEIMDELKKRDIKIAIGSSSKNSPNILKYIGLADYFDTTVDGNDISNSKPDPEVFVKAAERLNISPEECLVVEDAYAGIDAAEAGGMKSLGVGFASGYEKASIKREDLTKITAEDMLKIK